MTDLDLNAVEREYSNGCWVIEAVDVRQPDERVVALIQRLREAETLRDIYKEAGERGAKGHLAEIQSGQDRITQLERVREAAQRVSAEVPDPLDPGTMNNTEAFIAMNDLRASLAAVGEMNGANREPRCESHLGDGDLLRCQLTLDHKGRHMHHRKLRAGDETWHWNTDEDTAHKGKS